MNILKTLFLTKEIRSKKGDLHFRRWRILKTKWFNIYLHRIYRADRDRHCHDHPWSFLSIILWGGYAIARPSETKAWNYSLHTAPDITFNRAKDFHKIEHLNRVTTTLVLTGPKKRDWGYWVDGTWVQHQEYRDRKRNGEWE